MKHVLTKSVSVLAVCLLAAFVGAGCGGSQNQNTGGKVPGGNEPGDSSGDNNPVNPTCETDDSCTKNGQFCAPDPADTSRKICREVLKNSGAECEDDTECEDGTCLKSGEFYGRGGYCSKTACETAADCASYGTTGGLDSACVHPVQGDNFCASTCLRDDDCRKDYFCSRRASEARGACLPTSETLLAPQLEGEECKRVSSEELGTFTFRIPEGALGYHIAGRALDGGELLPFSIQAGGKDYYMFGYDTANNNEVIMGDDWRLGYTAYSLKSVISTFAPLGPNFASMVTPGKEVTLQVILKRNGSKARYSDVCMKMTPKVKEGKTLDLNVYLVGLPVGISVENGEIPTELNEVFNRVREIYGAAGIEIGKIRLIDAPEPMKKRFEFIRTDGSVGNSAAALVSLSKDPAASGENRNSLNVFFVKGITPAGTLGSSQGIPGLPGIHGMKGSGVVFSSVYLGKPVRYSDGTVEHENGSEYTGNTMAHEIGHFLGLFHTSESGGSIWDPLQDTPECPWAEMSSKTTGGAFCPDWNNLMFPSAGVTHTKLTSDQIYVISKNPLLY